MGFWMLLAAHCVDTGSASAAVSIFPGSAPEEFQDFGLHFGVRRGFSLAVK